MTATYISYRLFSQDFAKTTARTAARPDIAADTKYYQDNIGKVKSVDDLLKDQRLYRVAMESHGLGDMVFAKALIRKVLESDVKDTASFVNRLADKRYLEFAKAFNFTTSGGVKQSLAYAQNEFQQDDTIELYSEQRVKQGVAAATEAQYYQAKIATVATVDDLIGNARLYAFALNAAGIDPSVASKSFIRNVLTSDLDDPSSFANQLTDARYGNLAALFSFDGDGNAAGGAQSASQLDATVYANYARAGKGATPAAAAYNTGYYTATINTLASVDDLLNNDRLFAYALTAYGINPNTASKVTIRQVLTSDLNDPGSFANTLADPKYRTLAAAFNFATDGSVVAGEQVQAAADLAATTSRYFTTYDDSAEAAEAFATNLYRGQMNVVSKVDDLLNNAGLYAYALQAFGLDPGTEAKSKIRSVLTSDLSDRNSLANRQTDPRYRALAAAFNFGTDGKALQPREAQSETDELAIIRRYGATLGSSATDDARNKEEGAYYHNTISRVRSVDDLLKDKRLKDYVLRAFGLEGDRLSDATLKKALTSDPMDQASFLNTQGGDHRLRDMAAAFNFLPDGTVGRSPAQATQSRSGVLDTTDGYVRQMMEEDAGEQNEGVRLALYFQRKAPGITSALDILADKALLKVVQTALGLPAAMSQAKIEVQAAMIEKRLDVTDLKDATRVEKFLARFGALYDLENSDATAAGPATLLLGGDAPSIGTDVGLLSGMQRFRR